MLQDTSVVVRQVGVISLVVVPCWTFFMGPGVSVQVERGIELFVANSADMGTGS